MLDWFGISVGFALPFSVLGLIFGFAFLGIHYELNMGQTALGAGAALGLIVIAAVVAGFYFSMRG